MQTTAGSELAGHSLKGALANLCACDIAAAINESGAAAEGGQQITVFCYIFGAPRTGITAFRSEYHALIHSDLHLCLAKV